MATNTSNFFDQLKNDPNMSKIFNEAYMQQWSYDVLDALYKYPAKKRTKLQRAVDDAVRELST